MFIDNLRELLVLWLLQRCFVGFTARHSANNTHSLKIQCDIYICTYEELVQTGLFINNLKDKRNYKRYV